MTASTTYLLAIDPGSTGSASILRVTDSIELVACMAFGLKANKETWEQKLRDWCFLYAPDYIVVEHVHAMPWDGKKAAATFGGNKRAVLVALKFAKRKPDKLYDPQAWQRRIGCPHNYHIVGKAARREQGRKDQKAIALRLYPQLETVKGDVYASVLIGYATALDLIAARNHTPPGTVTA